VVKPTRVEELCKTLRYCNKERIGVVPQGGNTGLVGGSIPIDDEIIISLENMNTISVLDERNGVLECEAGCIVKNVQDFVKERDHLLPLDLGSKGSCMIGGCLSASAGGQYYKRFGSLHANTVGLEVVLSDGRILNMMNKNPKDNTGYHIPHLFIGSEGTLGIITRVALLCPTLPKSHNVCCIFCSSFSDVLQVLDVAKKELAEILAAFEYMDRTIIDLLHDTIQSFDKFNFNQHNFMLLLEVQGSNDAHDKEKIDNFLARLIAKNIISDAILAQDGKQSQQMWEARESCGLAVQQAGYTYKYDISLPIHYYYDMVLELKNHLKNLENPSLIVSSWGHLMDGNLHLNITSPNNFNEDKQILSILNSFIYSSVIKKNGSISAEHGIGQCKKKYLPQMKSANTLQLMKDIKHLMDPVGILNPGKLF